MIMDGKYSFLSNFHPCTIVYNGRTYQSVESAYQAQKDLSRSSEFEALSASQAKKLGKSIVLRSDWEDVKLQIMEDLLRLKFSDKELLAKLQSVDEPIVEDNYWHDTFWGVCKGKGENHLGQLLEKIKAEEGRNRESTEPKHDNPVSTVLDDEHCRKLYEKDDFER